MLPAVRAEYNRLRKLYPTQPAQTSLREARTVVAFELAEKQGYVEFRAIEDSEPYDASYIDTWAETRECERARLKEETLERAAREGCWGIQTLAMGPCGHLHEVDSAIWGFIGEDWRDSGYATDLMQAALDALPEDMRESLAALRVAS
jgi:hypothetical protein